MTSSIPLLESLPSTSTAYQPEDCPFETVSVDVTHRCNMTCHNCYLPNREIPDLDAGWLSSILERLPSGRRIRLIGAEPTLRQDLPDIIRDVIRKGHHPVIATNGLRLARREYVKELRRAGLRFIYLSFNGGFHDDLYEAIDNLRCATQKRAALENLCAENMRVFLGIIVARGVNEHVPEEMFRYARQHHQIRAVQFRAIGAVGRHMETIPFSMDELKTLAFRVSGCDPKTTRVYRETDSVFEFLVDDGFRIELMKFPDPGNPFVGRLTPEGNVQGFFEHMMANEGGY